jgi:hypothetical protein
MASATDQTVIVAYHEAMPADQVTMFRPRPSVGLGRHWHVIDRRLAGFMFVAPFPCGFVQAEIQCERTSTSRWKLREGETAVLETRCCRHCLVAVRQ